MYYTNITNSGLEDKSEFKKNPLLFCFLFAFVISDLYLYYMDYPALGGYSPRVFLTLGLIPIGFIRLFFNNRIRTNIVNKDTFSIISILIAYFFVIKIIDSWYSLNSFAHINRNIVYPIALIFVLLTVFGNNSRGILECLAIAGAISSVFALLQFLGIDFAWTVRGKISKYAMGSLPWSGRASGLDRRPWSWAFSAPLTISAAMALASSKGKFHKGWSLVVALIFLGTIVSFTRSAVGAIIIVITVILLLNESISKKRKFEIFTICLALLIVLFAFKAAFFLFTESRLFRLRDDSAFGRVGLNLVALQMFIDHPLGVGTLRFKEVAYKYIYQLNLSPGYMIAVGEKDSHNHLMNIITSYGIFGVLLLFGFYYFVYKLIRNLHAKKLEKARLIEIFSIAALVGVQFGGLFENSGIFLDFSSIYFVVCALIIEKYAFRYLTKPTHF